MCVCVKREKAEGGKERLYSVHIFHKGVHSGRVARSNREYVVMGSNIEGEQGSRLIASLLNSFLKFVSGIEQ